VLAFWMPSEPVPVTLCSPSYLHYVLSLIKFI